MDGVHASESGSISMPFSSSQENLYWKCNVLLDLLTKETLALSISPTKTKLRSVTSHTFLSASSIKNQLALTAVVSFILLCKHESSIQGDRVLSISFTGIAPAIVLPSSDFDIWAFI